MISNIWRCPFTIITSEMANLYILTEARKRRKGRDEKGKTITTLLLTRCKIAEREDL